ncbi:MAG: HlyD family efflux transporter periplasmic adaptor subunit [Gallionella sp.]|nr:HlyD family efflux transporter periplasmic adaptor subunit [Gallionella sp.]
MNTLPLYIWPRHISMTMLLFAGLATFMLWAALFEIEETVRAQGQVILSARTQIIQAADGGVLSRILVQEGESVAAGQLLAELEKERPNAAYEENRAKVASLNAALVRAQAEADGRNPAFGTAFKEFPQFVSAQLALYEQRKRSLREELKAHQDSLDMALEELRMNESLITTGDTSHLEVMRAKRQVAELQGKINAARNKYQQDARQEATRLVEELSSSRYKLEERQSVLGHTELTAPVAGVIKYLKITTIGGVLRAGDELMQISPSEGDRVIEIKVNPADIGQLKTSLPVSIKFDAFDYTIYGTQQGTLSYISSDTLTEQGSNGQTATYYRARVSLDAEEAKTNPKLANVSLKPGMTAIVDIRTASRSILQYLAKPVFKTFGGAMNER